MSYTVAQRTSEIGIRMALGAQIRDVLRLVTRDGLLQAGFGLLAGLVGAAALTRILASQLFDVSALDPATFASVALLLVAVAIAASYIPARRAMRVDRSWRCATNEMPKVLDYLALNRCFGVWHARADSPDASQMEGVDQTKSSSIAS